MERIYSPPDPRGNHFSRVTDLEHSQQWTSLASDINDLERAKMRHHVTSDLRTKHVLHRRSMPEPQNTSLIYFDVNTSEDYGTGSIVNNKSIADHYFLPIGSESIDESVDSWSWKQESDYNTSDKKYFGNNNNNYENYDYNRPEEESRVLNNRSLVDQEKKNDRNTYNGDSQLSSVIINKEKFGLYNTNDGRFDTEETAYRGSREKLHEIFRRNRDLRREFFATVPNNNNSEATKSWINASPVLKNRSNNNNINSNNRGEILQGTGSGYGSVETLTSHSNNSEISVTQNRITENSSRASENSRNSEIQENEVKISSSDDISLESNKNLKYAAVVDQTASLREFGGSVRDKKEGHYYSLPRGMNKNQSSTATATSASYVVIDPSKSLETHGFDGVRSPPPPPLPNSEPPSSMSGRQLLISGVSLSTSNPSSIISNPPDPPERQTHEKIKPSDAENSLLRDIANQRAYKPESEGLRMLNRFEARIENRKLSPAALLIPSSKKISSSNMPEDSQLSKKNFKSMPDLARSSDVSRNFQRGMQISRVAVNGSTMNLNSDNRDYSGPKFSRNSNNEDEEHRLEENRDVYSDVTQVSPLVDYVQRPERIQATRVDVFERSKSELGTRRRGVPPPLDLSKVSEALRREATRQDHKILRDYTVEATPLKGEIVKCKVTVVDDGIKRPSIVDNKIYEKPRVNTALKTATNLFHTLHNSPRSVDPVRGVSGSENNKKSEFNRSSEGSARFRSSVVVWCDGNSKNDDNSCTVQRRDETRRSLMDHRKSTGSLIAATGNVFPSVYAPIPYKSPRRYVEGEVTIHYRSPVRTEAKEVLSEAELARRSAENMRRVYQEERRRKYLQELHDIDSRRHTDNFTPSQKSPIPLNRYDDFVDDLSHRSRSQEQTPEPRLVAKALYNFVGQSSRELTFRRGDIIFVRRQVDKNWYEGEHNAMIGLFPFNYVEILPYDGIRTTTTPKKPYEGQARAKFNFVAQTTHELSLGKGDLVVLTRRVDENWYEGRIGNRKGIFPISYVEVLVEPGIRSETPAQNKPVAAPAAHSLLSNGSAGGKLSMGPHHYTPSIPTNTNTAQPHYNSLPRMGGTKLHVAPVNETLHIDTHSEPLRYRSLYNYRPQNEDELELKEGDTVYVMEKCDDGWFVGSSQRTGCFGTFPGNYVERL